MVKSAYCEQRQQMQRIAVLTSIFGVEFQLCYGDLLGHVQRVVLGRYCFLYIFTILFMSRRYSENELVLIFIPTSQLDLQIAV